MLPMRPRVHLPGRTGRQNRHALPGVRRFDSCYNGASLRGSLLFAIRPPATSWLAWGLSLIALILAFIFPSYGNGSTDPLYMLQCLPSMVFGCTAAILFIQGLAALRR